MGLRSRGKQVSFEILSSPKVASVDSDHPHAIAIPNQWSSDPFPVTGDKRNRRRRKHKKPKRNENLPNMPSTSNPIADSDFLSADDRNDEFEWSSSCYDHKFVREESTSTVCEGLYGELRQRSVNGGNVDDCEKEVVENEKEKMISRPNPSVELNARLKSEESLEWKRFMADDPIYPLPAETSPIKYFMEEMYSGYSLKSTTTLGSEKERESL